MIGGEGEKKTLRLVAQYGNACNLRAGGGSNEYAEGIESIRSKLAVLRGHCERLGRPYEEIERTALAGISLSQTSQAASDIVELCQALTALGVQHVIFNMPDGYELKGLEFFIKAILPKVKKLT